MTSTDGWIERALRAVVLYEQANEERSRREDRARREALAALLLDLTGLVVRPEDTMGPEGLAPWVEMDGITLGYYMGALSIRWPCPRCGRPTDWGNASSTEELGLVLWRWESEEQCVWCQMDDRWIYRWQVEDTTES